MDEAETKQQLVEAIAEHLSIPAEHIRGFIIGIEHLTAAGDELIFSAVWAAETSWLVNGYIEELDVNHKQARARQSFDDMLEAGVTDEPQQ